MGHFLKNYCKTEFYPPLNFLGQKKQIYSYFLIENKIPIKQHFL